MGQPNKKIASLVSVSVFLMLVPTFSAAQDIYPSHTVKLIFPYVAGSLGDVLARLIAEKLTIKFGQPVIVENRPGASGNMGAEAVGRAAPDGYTLLIAPPPPLAINQSLYPKLSFDPTNFVPLAVVATVPNVLVVNPRSQSVDS